MKAFISFVLFTLGCANAFVPRQPLPKRLSSSVVVRFLSSSSSPEPPKDVVSDTLRINGAQEEQTQEEKAAIGTVNERLLAELQDASTKAKYGASSVSSDNKRRTLDVFRSRKTDEERLAAIEEARNLNGVNPVITLIGGVFALGMAYGLWTVTNILAEYFALHPIDSDLYFVQRVTAVFRNVVIGLVALASGFFGVTGFGIFLLGVRVAYGVMIGELDPTPIKQKKGEEVEMPNVWELMTNQKNGRRRRKNPFDL